MKSQFLGRNELSKSDTIYDETSPVNRDKEIV